MTGVDRCITIVTMSRLSLVLALTTLLIRSGIRDFCFMAHKTFSGSGSFCFATSQAPSPIADFGFTTTQTLPRIADFCFTTK